MLFAGGIAGCSDSASPAAPTVSEQTELPRSALPLGVGELHEVWEQCLLADGVVLTRILRGEPQEEASALPCENIDRFELDGGGSGRITMTLTDGLKPYGPWAVHVLEVDPQRFQGQMTTALGQDRIVGKETPSSMAERAGAIAAINGGYFVVGDGLDQIDENGMAGDPAGIAVIDGELISEAVNGRTALAWTDGDPATADFPALRSQSQAVAADGSLWHLHGINRIPGSIRMCGGTGDTPTDEPRHDQTCTDNDELIAFTPIWGADTPGGDGVERIIAADGRVGELRARGSAIPDNGWVLTANGTNSITALETMSEGMQLSLQHAVENEGQPYALEAGLAIVNGGPLLLTDGEAVDRNVEEGFVEPTGGDPGDSLLEALEQTVYLTTYRNTGHPRTLAARTASDRVLFVQVDGRQGDWSVGLTFQDATELLQHFGAVEGMNLDGGGSATIIVNGQVVNHGSDGDERVVSDAILLIPH